MTATTAEVLSANGVILNTLAKNVESIAGRLTVPPLRTDNVAVPGKHGRLRTTAKFYEEGSIILPMWVVGCDDDGAIPADSNKRKMFFDNLDTLTNLFRPGDGMIDLQHTQPDGTIRRAWCECTDSISFAVYGNGNPLGKFSVNLRVPSAFWEDVDPITVTVLPTQNGLLTDLGGATAPIQDSVITITGPSANTKIEARYKNASLVNPSWVQYAGMVAAGQTLTIDCGTWTLTGTGGLIVDYSQLTHGNSSSWLTLVAPPWVKITASNTTSATRVAIRAKRKYLVG